MPCRAVFGNVLSFQLKSNLRNLLVHIRTPTIQIQTTARRVFYTSFSAASRRAERGKTKRRSGGGPSVVLLQQRASERKKDSNHGAANREGQDRQGKGLTKTRRRETARARPRRGRTDRMRRAAGSGAERFSSPCGSLSFPVRAERRRARIESGPRCPR